MTDQTRDAACMERIRSGDHQALAELYERHGSLMYSMVLRIVGRAEDAEEVLQEAWLQAWNRAAAYDASRGAVIAWLLTLARSRAIDRLRSPPMAPVEDPVATVAHRQLHKHVTVALAALAPRQREVLELAYFGGLSQSEIATRLETPLGTVKSWVRQGLLELRKRVPEEARS
ncbi:MAG: sigma-70 family RNA polymerase sigma factor [Candidatus Eisenbacteria bacterium]|uniref:Sigma-70 family RNA polymerase sigma factor n=1 Tax=Eiseniibacteriota bacterium TaxID=2212470 RepID=A0A538U2C5_UNCEI|nr:MAG: sigma-70 family RNA polymerase sigma factor [Candidatus Eisenbacteria bacterium]